MLIASDQNPNQATEKATKNAPEPGLNTHLQTWLPAVLRPFVQLFLAGHQPLSFVVGQSMLLLSPLADLAGWSLCKDWAMQLSDEKRAGDSL
jgi:hypothetical protein